MFVVLLFTNVIVVVVLNEMNEKNEMKFVCGRALRGGGGVDCLKL